MNILLYPILIPLLAGFICLITGKAARGVALLTSAVTVYFSGLIIFAGEQSIFMQDTSPLHLLFGLRAYAFSAWVLLAIAVFAFLIVLYSQSFMDGHRKLNQYYCYFLLTLASAAGTILSGDLLTLLVFWGFSGFTLYRLIGINATAASAAAAKKTFIIVGGTDALMILGAALVFALTRTFNLQALGLPLNHPLTISAYLLLVSGSLAKAGALPFSSWVPESATVTPATVMAYLPASLDKLVGIYFLARLSLDIFIVQANSVISILLLATGSLTLIFAVLMALQQHNFYKLLSYHTVSQVGYMLIGIGTAVPVGIAGGLFHMLNNAIYKTCLFLCGGAIEFRTKLTELKDMGGLAAVMPITLFSALICALAISGVPPLNGFISKWMIYQGILASQNNLWIIWLLAAMLGSILTMASFTKLIHAAFFSQSTTTRTNIKEVPATMWIPMVTLAMLCLICGVFAFQLPLPYFIFQALPTTIDFATTWNPMLAAFLLCLGLLIGFLIYYAASRFRAFHTTTPFLGGEKIQTKVTGDEFYNTIPGVRPLRLIHRLAKSQWIDVYEPLKGLVFGLSGFLRWFHRGLVQTYLLWCLAGFLAILYFLVK
jgi:formate hydrogenlyase subunit 3/multisubunit Na+/H+ antiporter MnhD subunit